MAPAQSFPVEFELTTADAAVEGDWWYKETLIVSVRWDTDGVAATRDPNDLVGRAVVPAGGLAKVELQGRGVAGKFVTQKQ